MRESIQKLVRVGATSPRFVGLQRHVLTFLIAPTIQSHEMWNFWQEWEVGKFEGSPMLRQEPKRFLECMCKIHIGPFLVYPAIGSIPDTTIDYTATTDPYSTFVTAYISPQRHNRKLVQATTVRESALNMLSWKDQRSTREQLELKGQSGSIEDWKSI